MKAWLLDVRTHKLALHDRPPPEPRPGAIAVRVEAAMVLSYMKEVLTGGRGHAFPARDFVPGTDAVGTVTAVGDCVHHVAVGQRVLLGPYVVAADPSPDAARLLLGHMARFGAACEALQADWIDGSFAEVVEWPCDLATPLEALGAMSSLEALGLAKLVVPYGGLLRIGVQAGEIVAVNGASGFYGSAGVLVALAMGAARVLAVGRDPATLAAIAERGGSRVVPVVMTGHAADETRALRAAAGGIGIDAALDMIGAKSPSTTGSVLRALRRGGRLVMMGSCTEPLAIGYGEMLANDWLIAGNFMYPADAPARLVRLVASGQLALSAIEAKPFPLAELPRALDAATKMRGFDLTALVPAT
jgi:alcohol dehydrogenase